MLDMKKKKKKKHKPTHAQEEGSDSQNPTVVQWLRGTHINQLPQASSTVLMLDKELEIDKS